MAATPNVVLGLTRTYDLIENLIDDINKAYEALDKERESQFLRRVVVRNVFSFIEAIIQIIKYELKRDFKLSHTTMTLSAREREILNEQKVNNTNAENIKIRIPVDQNLKCTFRLAIKVWGLAYAFNTNDESYRIFVLAKNIRNKLTHPRTYYDIEITDKDMEHITMTFIWIRDEFSKLFRSKVMNVLKDLPDVRPEDIFGG